jgi:ABC-type glycerol-3-phosphate transport system substrate-binding protein
MPVRRKLRLTAFGAVLGVGTLLSPSAQAQEKKLTLLTWNIPVVADLIEGWIAEFEQQHPGFEVEWLDKKGTEWATFYQTQVIAGTPPDIIDVQGGLWLEYAANGGLLDLTPYLEEEPDVQGRFNADYLANWVYEGSNYMLPFYISKTLLFYSRKMFEEAGLSAPPQSFDQILEYAAKVSGGEKTGFMTLNFDWLYWPLFAMNGVELLNEDMTEAAFNTPETLEVLTRLAEATNAGHINGISWTGRWVEPNNAFAAGTVGMHHAHSPAFFYIRGQGDWVSPETLAAAHMPGGYATPNSHGLGISSSTKYPDEAWELVKLITSKEQAYAFSSRLKVLSGNIAADERVMSELREQDPLGFEILQTQLEHTDKMVGTWRTPKDAQIKEAFWPEIQAALLGQKEPAAALEEAERKVNRVLRRP